MRYHHVGEHFTHHGYSALAFGLRGYGESTGLTGHSPTHDQLIDDVEQFLIKIRNANNDIQSSHMGIVWEVILLRNFYRKEKQANSKLQSSLHHCSN
jgi:hypothetical protein